MVKIPFPCQNVKGKNSIPSTNTTPPKHWFSPYQWIDTHLLTCPAYLSLKGIAPHMLGIFWTKRQWTKSSGKKRKKRYTLVNNGKIIFTYDEAKTYGFSYQRFSKGISELIEKGFLDITELGGGTGGTPTKFMLSTRYTTWGTPEFEQHDRVKQLAGYKFQEKT